MAATVARTISADNEKLLTSLQLLTPANTNGLRTLSVFSFRKSASPSTSSSEDHSIDDSIEIPAILDSPESLHWRSLTNDAASEIFARWQRSSSLQSLLDFALVYIGQQSKNRDAMAITDDWDRAWSDMGITSGTRQAMLKPEHRSVPMTRSASGWAKWLVSNKYEWLCGLDAAVTECTNKSKNASVRPCSPNPNVSPSPAIQPSSSKASKSSVEQQPQPPVETLVKLPESLQGHILLYKEGETVKLSRIWSWGDSPALEFANVYSQPPTDFHPLNSRMLYFSNSKQVAVQYAAWCEDALGSKDQACILYVAVPNEILEEATPIYGDDFRQLVWECQTDNPRGAISTHLQHYTTAPLLVGPMAQTPPGSGVNAIQPPRSKRCNLKTGPSRTSLLSRGMTWLTSSMRIVSGMGGWKKEPPEVSLVGKGRLETRG